MHQLVHHMHTHVPHTHLTHTYMHLTYTYPPHTRLNTYTLTHTHLTHTTHVHLPHIMHAHYAPTTNLTLHNTYTRFTVSSSSSSQQSSVPLDSITEEPPNPFLPQCINFMLNSLGFPMNKMERIGGPVPRLAGTSVTLGKERFASLRRLADGGYAIIFTATQEDTQKALKVS